MLLLLLLLHWHDVVRNVLWHQQHID